MDVIVHDNQDSDADDKRCRPWDAVSKLNTYELIGDRERQPSGSSMVLEERPPFYVTPYSLFLAKRFPKFLPLAEKTVVDFGVGCGIQSVVAAKYGARKVIGIDIHPEALTLSDRNMRRNGHKSFLAINAETENWSSPPEKVDYIVSNPSSLPALYPLEATYGAGCHGTDMLEKLYGFSYAVLRSSGALMFVHTSLVDLEWSLGKLRQLGFAVGIVETMPLAFRDFYAPMLPHWKELRTQGKAFWFEKNGQNYEILYLLKAERATARKE